MKINESNVRDAVANIQTLLATGKKMTIRDMRALMTANTAEITAAIQILDTQGSLKREEFGDEVFYSLKTQPENPAESPPKPKKRGRKPNAEKITPTPFPPDDAPKFEPMVVRKRDAPQMSFRFGVFSDGELHLFKHGVVLRLNQVESAALCKALCLMGAATK
ncbi:hypothetical protein MIS45_11005 [Wielerella bovis]|uniref:hypothetical protein n=1 Tax=Wielerella bovis TaxID=2917790 RepID=UPI00201922C6|nr:hypothetical protein [Wielerella bovis]ULJ69249.1 hypothetical protein MIS45_11005 [Wielerella bovis]